MAPGLKLQLLIPELFQSQGGIQVFSGFLLEAIARIYPRAEIQVCLKHDTQALAPHPQCTYSFAGTFPPKLRTLAYSSQIITRAWRSRPDLIIATHLNFAPVALGLKRTQAIPYWLIAHGIEAWQISNPLVKTALRYADQILAVSDFTRDRLIAAQNLNPAQVQILTNTFDHQRFTLGAKPSHLFAKYQIPSQARIMLTVARLDQSEQYKGYDQVIRLMPQLLRQIPNLHYLIVGKGNDLARIQALIHSLAVQDRVTLAGFVPDQDLGAHYQLCDLFIMPSKGEGFGIVFLEALASGKPVIAGNQDGSVTALKGGELGILVDPDQPDLLAEAIIQVLTDRYQYDPNQLRQQAIANFGFAAFTHQLQTHFTQAGL
ncbi:MAG: glycosyltransferase family 4 protein [Pseudanabaenaceae cyanobacterium bins.68]|nr:glycosyltransferase family 4 protein [Pseudanabaenaceae cyanobacterium bins.68]